MFLKACLNGARSLAEHPALPVTPQALAHNAAAVAAAGVGSVHLHVKDAEGADTLDGAALAVVLTAVRETAPGLPIGVTTGAWETRRFGSELFRDSRPVTMRGPAHPDQTQGGGRRTTP